MLGVPQNTELEVASVADCFFVLGMLRLSSGSEDPAKCLLD